jgi:hypothetical protein
MATTTYYDALLAITLVSTTFSHCNALMTVTSLTFYDTITTITSLTHTSHHHHSYTYEDHHISDTLRC